MSMRLVANPVFSCKAMCPIRGRVPSKVSKHIHSVDFFVQPSANQMMLSAYLVKVLLAKNDQTRDDYDRCSGNLFSLRQPSNFLGRFTVAHISDLSQSVSVRV